MPDPFISVRQLSRLAGIDRRNALLAVTRALKGGLWRGAELVVRKVRGSGGAAGNRYEVAVSSLPAALRLRWHQLQPDADLREQAAEHAMALEQERRQGERRKRERFMKTPWTQEEREARHAAFSRLPTSTQAKARERLAAVRFFYSLAGTALTETERYAIAARQASKSTSTLRNWIGMCKNLDPGDWAIALAPAYKGSQPAAKFSAEAREFIWHEYFRLTKPALKPIYRRAIRRGKERGWEIPAYATVKRLIDAEPHHYRVLMRDGQEAFERLYPTQQRNYSTIALHDIWCCDGRQADIFCRWEDGTVSRPIVITWLEVRSRVVLAFRITRTESADSIRLAFKAAAEKARAIPGSVLLDNSRAFASKLLTGGAATRFRFKVREEDVIGILTLMGIGVIWALPFAGRSKPVESFHRQYAEAEKRFDGAYCGAKPDARPENCDPAKAVPIEEYRKLLEETLAEYHARPHRGDAMENRSPREVYETLLPQCAPRQPTREQLRLCLLAAESVRLAPDDGAVRLLGGNRYWSASLVDLPRDRHYTVRFHPEDASEPVHVFDGERFICEAPLLTRTGFRNQEAAKRHAQAKREYLNTLKAQARTRSEMDRAREWIAPPDLPEELQRQTEELILPAPKVVTPLRPERDYRPQEPEISDEEAAEVLQAIFDYHQRRAGERSQCPIFEN